jgi:hypothetical protein
MDSHRALECADPECRLLLLNVVAEDTGIVKKMRECNFGHALSTTTASNLEQPCSCKRPVRNVESTGEKDMGEGFKVESSEVIRVTGSAYGRKLVSVVCNLMIDIPLGYPFFDLET